MSHENENEIVLTIDTFRGWCETVNGNQAAMKQGGCSALGKPVYHLNEATGTKTELESYEFVFHPLKLDITADDVIDLARAEKIREEVKENPQPNKTATARYFTKTGSVIVEHCIVPNA